MVPISSTEDAGSAFLVRDESCVWLVTCAHILTGTRDSPKDWTRWQRRIVVHPHGGASFNVEMFEDTGPRFGWILDGRRNLYVEDAIAVRLDDLQSKLLSQYIHFPRTSIRTANVGDMTTCFGYPGIGNKLPTRPLPSAISGLAIQIDHQMIFSHFRSTAGYSGGPLLAGSTLIGLMSGNAFDPNGPATSIDLSLVAASIFA